MDMTDIKILIWNWFSIYSWPCRIT